jgi:hypothetical protein
MDANSLKYYLEHLSNNEIYEERVKENMQLKRYLIMTQNITFPEKKVEQIINKSIRLTFNVNSEK